MADEEHLDILRQGVDTWNQWREDDPYASPDLSGSSLKWAELAQVNFCWADLSQADLYSATLSRANLIGADLSGADLSQAWLTRANLTMAKLEYADLKWTRLSEANLFRSRLKGTIFKKADLRGANFRESIFNATVIIDVDLSEAEGLDEITHIGPSNIGIDTIYRSGGVIPKVFLRGVGIPDQFIEYIQSLTTQGIQYYSCFISYSTEDQEFAERLYSDLQDFGIRCWFAAEDMRIGDKIRPRIDEEIRLHDKLLLVLSSNSITSQWVEKEVETAFEQERRLDRIVLFPIRLDNCVMDTDQAWAADIRRTRHIGDFRDWKQPDHYKLALDRLLRDLKTSY
jgi:uncharacterized protein YjbI with pentapeptide repeats